MAKKTTADSSKTKKVRRMRKVETVRERSTKKLNKPAKVGLVSRIGGKISRFFTKVTHVGRKEIYIPMPDNKVGRFMNKRRSFIPKYFKESWQEVKKVTWPDRKQTIQLTFAVFMFAFIFGALITIVDYGLDKVFKSILLK